MKNNIILVDLTKTEEKSVLRLELFLLKFSKIKLTSLCIGNIFDEYLVKKFGK